MSVSNQEFFEPKPAVASDAAALEVPPDDAAHTVSLPGEVSVIEIGQSEHGATQIDLGRLLKTRLLIQAGSGGGKSWCLRRFIEQSYGKVRMIVFDPEGELVTLADQFEFSVCSPDSETNPIYPDGGAAAARAIYLSGRSAILSMSEFDGLEEMQLFVAEFCRELLRMPASSWHHLVLVFDEAQLFAPQQDKAVSKKPLVDLARRGRKRGMCPVVATQRLSELSKGVASHLENKMIGLTSLELDIASAAKMLGMRPAVARQQLRCLANGRFICFGPALSFDLVETMVGAVSTRHGSLEEYRGVAAPVVMSAEALGNLLKSSSSAPARSGHSPHDDGELQSTASSQPVRSSGSRRFHRQPTGSSRGTGERSLASLSRSFEVASQVVHGRRIEEIAREHRVTDQSVRNWLHRAVGCIDLGHLGIVADPLRVDDLRENRLRVDTALRRAKLNTAGPHS